MLSTLLNYATQFRQLHTNYTHKNNQSPHKFVLLLAIIRLYEQEDLQAERIYLTENIRRAFEREWHLWVRNPHHKMRFGLPVYHMKSEPFWRFVLLPENEEQFENKSLMRTFSNLQEIVDYVEIDAELVALFRQPETRELLKDVLLARLFEILGIKKLG